MSLATMELQIGSMSLEVEAVKGEVKQGQVRVSEVEVTFLDTQHMAFGEKLLWDEEEIKKRVRSSWMEQDPEAWPDTDNTDWESPRILTPGTTLWRTLCIVEFRGPIKSTAVEDSLNMDYSVGGHLSKLKETNLIAVVGYSDGIQVVSTTHIGTKELWTEYAPGFRDNLADAIMVSQGESEAIEETPDNS